uniref:Uncharacterized protein n=1 Tax=Knipowitschia caucasica TaxID=637954 RepID=A0AAV2L0I7_KNICA
MGDNESLVASEASNDPPRSPSPIPPEPAAASTPDAFPSIASDTSSSAQRVVTGKRKRALFQTETVEMMRQIQAEDVSPSTYRALTADDSSHPHRLYVPPLLT